VGGRNLELKYHLDRPHAHSRRRRRLDWLLPWHGLSLVAVARKPESATAALPVPSTQQNTKAA